MRETDGARVEAALAADQEQAERRLASLSAGFDDIVAASQHSNADDEHDPEGATIAFERSQSDALVRQARARLDEITAARARLAEGRYGLCEVCGQPVDPERLEARPTARTCVGCARA